MPDQSEQIASLNSEAGEKLAEAMETMAFVSALPPDDAQVAAPTSAVLLQMKFTGPVSGVVEMVAADQLGQTIAENILPPDPSDPSTAISGDDALKELLNVTCGSLFRNPANQKSGNFDIALPQLTKFDATKDWSRFVESKGTTVLDAEGSLIAIHVKAA